MFKAVGSERLFRWLRRLRKDEAAYSLARGAGGLFLTRILGTGLALATQVMLARTLGAAHYGEYVVAWGWVMLFAVASTAGHATAALRFISQYLGAEDWPRLRGYLMVAMASVAIASTAFALLVVGTSHASPLWAASPMTELLAIGALVIPIQAALLVASSVIRGLRAVVASQIPLSLVQPLALMIMAATALVLRVDTSGSVAMIWAAIAALIALVVSLRIAMFLLPAAVHARPALRETGEWTRVAFPLFLITVLNMVLQRADVLIVGARLGSEPAAVYAAANRLSLLVSFGLTAVNAWVAPTIADLHARGERAALQRTVHVAARAIGALTVPLAVGTALTAGPLLEVFGSGFEAGRASLWILCIGQIVNALLGPVGFLMTMTGNQSDAARILFVAAILNVSLCVFLIPRLGIEGAAVGTSSAQILWNVWMSLVVWKRLRIRTTIV
jgi:O-antigen/teichoic acid export membrane protein